MTEAHQVIADLIWFLPDGGTLNPDQLGRAAIDRLSAAGFKIEPTSRNVRGALLNLPLRETTRAAEYALSLVNELDAKQHRELQFATGRALAMVRRLEALSKGRGSR